MTIPQARPRSQQELDRSDIESALRAWKQDVKDGKKKVQVEPEHMVRLIEKALKVRDQG